METTLNALADFARTRIRSRPELLESTTFPMDIWADLGAADLMGLAIDPAFGGKGFSFAELSRAAAVFAEAAAVPGMAMSWLGHNLMGRLLIQNIGTNAQKKTWLPRIASGEVTVAVAISEPGAGAHPKFLTGTARRDGGDFIIQAEKAFVTNGPIAGLFVVLAITGETGGRKEFTALLVPGGSEAIKIRPMENPVIDFLRPAPHGLIHFDDVRVSADNVLGPVGKGFDVVSKRVRLVEDAVGLGAAAGNLNAYLALLADCLTAEQRSSDEVHLFFGKMQPRLEGLATLAAEAARAVDEGRAPTVGGAAGALAAEARRAIADFVEREGIAPTYHFGQFARDMDKSGNIARRARDLAAQKSGKAYLEGLVQD